MTFLKTRVVRRWSTIRNFSRKPKDFFRKNDPSIIFWPKLRAKEKRSYPRQSITSPMAVTRRMKATFPFHDHRRLHPRGFCPTIFNINVPPRPSLFRRERRLSASLNRWRRATLITIININIIEASLLHSRRSEAATEVTSTMGGGRIIMVTATIPQTTGTSLFPNQRRPDFNVAGGSNYKPSGRVRGRSSRSSRSSRSHP